MGVNLIIGASALFLSGVYFGAWIEDKSDCGPPISSGRWAAVMMTLAIVQMVIAYGKSP